MENMKSENLNEEIEKLKDINSKQLSEIMSLQEKIEELLNNNINSKISKRNKFKTIITNYVFTRKNRRIIKK